MIDLRIGEHNFDTEFDCDPDEPTICLPAPIDMKISEKIVHPDYNSENTDTHSDIALLRLAEKVVFTDAMTPVCLPLDPALWTTDFNGKVFQVTGWGEYRIYVLPKKIPTFDNFQEKRRIARKVMSRGR